MIQHDYVYDLTHQPYQSEFLDENSGLLRQTFTIPEGIRSVHGLRIRLSKYGNPGPVELMLWRAGRTAPLASGIIASGEVTPVFERMVGIDFDPCLVTPGERLELRVRVLAGQQPLDAYRIYGPNTRSELVSEGGARFPYWWYLDPNIRLDDVNASLPVGYRGAGLPDYNEGERLDAAGRRTWSISFQVLTDRDETEPSLHEQQFEFVQALTTEPFSEWVCVRNPARQPKPGEAWITQDWKVDAPENSSPVLNNAVLELTTFLGRVLGVSLTRGQAQKTIRLSLKETEDKNPEAFRVSVTVKDVHIVSGDPRGLLRGVFWLEREMLLQRAPALAVGEYQVKPRYETRMVPGIYPAPTYFMLREAQIFTRGYLWRLARAGYNAVYFQASIEDFVENSTVFPEMNDPEAPVVIERLRRAVELAAEYGVAFYWDLKTGYEKPFPESIYERLPHLHSFRKFGNFPCTGQPETLAFIGETIANVFRKVEKLRGIVLVYDTEGFYSCITHNAKDNCPYCKNYSIEELGNRIFDTLKQSMRILHSDRDLVLWTYICDEPWNYRLIRSMPSDVILMACYSQLQRLNRFNTVVLADDYSLCSDAPSDYFLKVKAAAAERGLRFYCKTEDTFAQEFVSTPFTPCLEQHQRRWDRLAQEDTVTGMISQYLHVGFTPTPCQDLMVQNVFEVRKDGRPFVLTPREKLTRAACLNYGSEVSELVTQAWESFSQAIRDYFPYTWGVCRYPGPLQSAPGQPFQLDPAQPMARSWARGYVNDLKWTGIRPRFLLEGVWNDAVVERCLFEVRRCYQTGNLILEKALDRCDPVYRTAIRRDLNVSQMQESQVETVLNWISFFRLRAAYSQEPTPFLVHQLAALLQQELVNSEQALCLAQSDSRLGFSCEGDGNVRGGHFTPVTIQAKIAGLRETLAELYDRLPEFGNREQER
jgi:hypothetical protein